MAPPISEISVCDVDPPEQTFGTLRQAGTPKLALTLIQLVWAFLFAILGGHLVGSSYLDAFEYHYNKIATPFDWTFTRHDLEAPIARVARHEPYSSSPPNQLRTNDRNH